VRAALARVGLDDCLHEVFTAADLGARKPDPAFFLAALRRLSVDPREAAMVGDSYAEDVVGAKRAGLFALWWNERGASCPDPHPLYDAELLGMSSLPALLAAPFLPDVAACLPCLQSKGRRPNSSLTLRRWRRSPFASRLDSAIEARRSIRSSPTAAGSCTTWTR